MEELTVVIEDVYRYNASWSLLSCRAPQNGSGWDDPLLVSIGANREEFELGETYRFLGMWQPGKYRRGRELFKVNGAFCRVLPLGRQDVIRYLRRRCKGHGIGSATANHLWKRFGPDTIDRLMNDPAACANEIDGLSVRNAKRASARGYTHSDAAPGKLKCSGYSTTS